MLSKTSKFSEIVPKLCWIIYHKGPKRSYINFIKVLLKLCWTIYRDSDLLIIIFQKIN